MIYFNKGDRVVIKKHKGLIIISCMKQWRPGDDYSVIIDDIDYDEENNEVIIKGIHQVSKWFEVFTQESFDELTKIHDILKVRNNEYKTYNSFIDRIRRKNPIIKKYDFWGFLVDKEYDFYGSYPLDKCCFEMENSIKDNDESV